VPLPLNLPRRTHDKHLVVCGDSPLAHRMVEELAQRLDDDVVAIVKSRTSRHGARIAALGRVDVIEATELTGKVLREAGVRRARALALADQDDVGNLHAALRAKELNPDLQIVLRMASRDLGRRVERLIDGCRSLSDAATAAPAFVAAALGDDAPSHVRVHSRTFHVARRGDVPPEHIACGLASDDTEHSARLLPEDPPKDSTDPAIAAARRNDLVLAVAPGQRETAARRRRWWTALLTALRMLTQRWMFLVLAVLCVLLVIGMVLLGTIGGYSTIDAVYVALLDTAGAANPDLAIPGSVKAAQALMTVVGLALIPVVTAVVVEARIVAKSSRPGRLVNHTVVVGLGQVGRRVAAQLNDLGVPVLAIEKDERTPGILMARRLGIPVLIADAVGEEILLAAGVRRARALLAMTSDDATNLEVSLHARALRNDLRVVLRLFEDDMANRVQEVLDIPISRSVSYLAAPEFIDAMLNRDVLGSIPVGRRLLLLADVPIEADSQLVGQPLADVEQAGAARVIGLLPVNSGVTDWSPDPAHRLVPGDRLVTVATRGGLMSLVAHGTRRQPPPAAPPPPHW
jgi:Trk K+ transport system NAD-binding subunit